MKEFWIYTGLRALLFLASFGIVVGLWLLFTDDVSVLAALIIALVVSGVGSYFLLNRPRELLARQVQSRAERMTAKVEEMKAKEDQD
ncbi:DUF4229 domain-containing protein [Nocardioides hungaricus]